MSGEQILLQLSIASLTVMVLLRVVLAFLKHLREGEAERTKAATDNETLRTKAIADGFAGMATALVSLNGKIDSHEHNEQEYRNDTSEKLTSIDISMKTAIGIMRGTKQ